MLTGRKILLADDSLTIQKVVSLTFGDEGCIVICVSDGAAALEKMAEIKPDIVLADIHMPALNGYELCRRIRESESFQHVPVMLLVGTFEPYDEEEARRVGANDVLTKPFQSIRELVGKVGNLLGGKSKDETGATGAARPEATPYGADSSLDDEMIEATPIRAQTVSHVEPTLAPTKHEMSAADAHDADTVTSEAPPEIEPASHGDVADGSRGGEFPSPEVRQAPLIHEASATADESPRAETAQAVDLSSIFESHPATSSAVSDAQSGAPTLPAEEWEEEVLELDEAVFVRDANEDFILELEDVVPAESFAPEPLPVFETTAFESTSSGIGVNVASPTAVAHEPLAEPAHEGSASHAAASAPVMPEATSTEARGNQAAAVPISPELVEAVARRVVELMSSKIIEEIAWEVVPQLSEALIKRKLEGGKI